MTGPEARIRSARWLAPFGAITLIVVASAVLVNRFSDRHVRGQVLAAEDDRPIANVPVFLNDGETTRRASTDADGRFEFKVESSRRSRAAVLICPPEHLALVSNKQPSGRFGDRTFHTPRRPLAARKLTAWTFGWRAAVPAECSALVASPDP